MEVLLESLSSKIKVESEEVPLVSSSVGDDIAVAVLERLTRRIELSLRLEKGDMLLL